MSYASLTKANLRFQLTMLAVLFGLFVITVVLMNLHPTVAILVFLLGLVVLGLFAIAEWMIRKAERAAARKELRAHHCPHCGGEVDHGEQEDSSWHCERCDSTFSESGFEQ